MNLLLVEASEVDSGQRVRLSGRRAKHLRKVLRVEPGRVVRAGVIGGPLGTGRVLSVGAEEVEIELELEAEAPAASRHLEVVLALPRPAVLHRVLQTVATMEVRRLDLVRSWRVEKSYFDSPALEPEALRRHLVLGAEQGGRTRLPEVGVHRLFAPFLEQLGSRRAKAERLVAHPLAAHAIEEVFPAGDRKGSVCVALGPEGGWIDREVESLERLGFRPVRLGPWVLRVEAALTAMLAQVELLRRR